nr:exopolysaccharide biosynthesis protein [uncultured Rhodopila sp.]
MVCQQRRASTGSTVRTEPRSGTHGDGPSHTLRILADGLPAGGATLGSVVDGLGSAGILIVLPIPFGNTAPAVAMLILSPGLLTGDGLAVAGGILATVVATAIDGALVGFGFAAVAAVVASVL